MNAPVVASPITVGIDVSEDQLDIVLRRGSQTQYRRLSNRPAGFEQLHQWLCQHQAAGCWVCLEATGSYSDALALFLYEQGYQVGLLNPAVLVASRKSKQRRSKTDKADAALLAQYAAEDPPVAWQPLPAEVRELRGLLERRDDLKSMIGAERNRLHAQRLPTWGQQSAHEHLLWLSRHLQELERVIRAHIQAHPSLLQPWQRLQTIPGIGPISAAYLLAHIGDISRFSHAGTLVSLAGLAVKERVSGKSVSGRPVIDRHGRGKLRWMLYMGALVSLRFDPAMQQWAERLRARGKPTKVVMVAAMRKLLHIVYGVWKHDCDYDPDKAFAQVA